MFALVTLLTLIGFFVGLICLIHPFESMRIPTRPRAAVVMLGSIIVFIVAGSMIAPESTRQDESRVVETQKSTSAVTSQQESETSQSAQTSIPQTTNEEVAWTARPFEIISDKDISFVNRFRRTISIVAPTALTREDRIATMMAAARQSWDEHHSQFIGVDLLPFESGLGRGILLGQIYFAPDKCGISGKECTDRIWTNASASDVIITPEQEQIYTAWHDNADRFKEVDPNYGLEVINEERLDEYIAAQFDTTSEDVSDVMVQVLTAAFAKNEISLPQHLDLVQFDKEDQEKVDEKACQASLQCWGDKHSIAASVICPDFVEQLANYDSEWTDGLLEFKFSRFAWHDYKKGLLTYIGDQIKFQNGFGAWIPHIYHCDFDPFSQQVLAVDAFPKN